VNALIFSWQERWLLNKEANQHYNLDYEGAIDFFFLEQGHVVPGT
jgi:hypothetical protein